MEQRRIVFVVYEGIQPLDVVGPHEVFAGANAWLDGHRARSWRYRLDIVGDGPDPVIGESGLGIVTTALLDDVLQAGGQGGDRSIDTLIVPGGNGAVDAIDDQHLVAAVTRLAGRSRRTGSVCSGAFLLAAAGLVDGRSVATHWARARELAERFPDVRVDVDALWLRDDPVWTSAGVTAGIDLALAMVEDDLGAEAAQTIARHLVMFLRRPGGQSQFAAPVWDRVVDRDPIRIAIDGIHAQPDADHSLASMARKATMSTRHFSRVFRDEVGVSPGRFVEQVRVREACRRLEQGCARSDVVHACGFGTDETMRRAFHRHLGVSPTAYRERFGHGSHAVGIESDPNDNNLMGGIT